MAFDVETLVVGCGNVLFKDDGYGPKVIDALNDYFKDKEKPESTEFIDAGTSATHYIFSLPEETWKKIIIIDVVEYKAEPGTVKKFSIDEIPQAKYEDAHSWPVEEPLHRLSEETGVEIVVIGCKPEYISAPDVEMGLSKPVEDAIPETIGLVLEELGFNDA